MRFALKKRQMILRLFHLICNYLKRYYDDIIIIGDNMEFIENKIVKDDFLKIKEDRVMFITNPGRMGDEDGSTFIIKEEDEFKIYRLDNWMYRSRDFDEREYISLDDALKQFPKWKKSWNNKDNKGKYTYLYMGFGNGLAVDNRIYEEFKPYLDKRVKKYLEKKEDKESMQYAAVFDTWKDAFLDMINNK